MPEVNESIVVNKPRAEVYDFLMDPANVLVVNSNLTEYEHVSGDVRGLGAVFRGVVRVVGRNLPFTAEYVEVTENEKVVSRSTDAKIPYTLTLSYEDAPGGTKVTWHQQTEPFGGFFGKLGDAVVVKLYERDVKSNLEKGKALMES